MRKIQCMQYIFMNEIEKYLRSDIKTRPEKEQIKNPSSYQVPKKNLQKDCVAS